ncbi:beta-galactosidase [Streptomyces sp. NBC_00250]|uniref:beta-galactosidase n=1 Tax=Streptomyces sp. NBC_00250 TaxID=2903641 RepID=UPI002E2BE1E9|nr:beta-galactosidase [Streptomyces sp. NBC_00250]
MTVLWWTGSRGATAALAVAAVLLLLVGAFGVLRHEAPEPKPERYWYGTLQTDPDRARTEYEHGIRVAHLQIDWGRLEPEQGVYDEEYAREVRDRIEAFRGAGLRVEAGLGLNHPPSWLPDAFPESVYVNQYGERSTRVPNIVFSEPVREHIAEYARAVDRLIGFENFWAVRVGVNESGEFAYPSPLSESDGPAEFWAYDSHAQESSPYPGWRPGERTYHGRPFTREQVAHWYDWYVGKLAGAVNWQLDLYASLGYQGALKILIPGSGFYPSDLRAAVDARLVDSPSVRLVARGAGFFLTLPLVEHRDTVRIVTTALVDGTGDPVDNGCSPADARTDVAAPNDARVRDWSSARWVVAVARSAGFTRLTGESAGPQVSPYRPGVTETAYRQMASCGLEGLMWAFDGQLYDGTPGSSLEDYAETIRRHP